MSWNQSSSYVPVDVRDERVTSFLSKVYGWMFLGLMITAGVGLVVASSEALIETLLVNSVLRWILLLAPVGLAWFLMAREDSIAPTTATILFLVYAALMGITFGLVFLIYTSASIVSAFMISSGMFGTMAVFGAVTKKNLTGLGQLMLMGLVGLFIAIIVNLFLRNDAMSFVISIVGVIVFTGLTAYDSQRLKEMAVALPDGRVGAHAVVGALYLYLDFINIFLFILRLFGGRRD